MDKKKKNFQTLKLTSLIEKIELDTQPPPGKQLNLFDPPEPDPTLSPEDKAELLKIGALPLTRVKK